MNLSTVQNRKHQNAQPHPQHYERNSIIDANYAVTLKRRFLMHYLKTTCSVYIIPDDVANVCLKFCEDHPFICLQLRLLYMIEQRKHKYFKTHQVRKRMKIKDDCISIFDEINRSFHMIGYCPNIKIIVMNDFNMKTNCRIRFHQDYSGGNVYIQCKTLFLSNLSENCAIVTQPADDTTGQIYKLNNKHSSAYENGNIYINAERNIRIANVEIGSGFVSIVCGNNLEIANDARIRSFGRGTSIKCNGELKLTSSPSCVIAYNNFNHVECANRSAIEYQSKDNFHFVTRSNKNDRRLDAFCNFCLVLCMCLISYVIHQFIHRF
eukprot:106760_1